MNGIRVHECPICFERCRCIALECEHCQRTFRDDEEIED